MARKKKTQVPPKLPQPVRREPLSDEEKAKLGKHAGELGRQIELADEALKVKRKKHKEKTDPLRSELRTVLEQLRTGVREVPAQQSLKGV